MEREPGENLGLIAEVASQEHLIPLTEGQEARLALLDEDMKNWFSQIDKQKARDQEFRDYMKRTHDLDNLQDRP